jgi:hypothetical protein
MCAMIAPAYDCIDAEAPASGDVCGLRERPAGGFVCLVGQGGADGDVCRLLREVGGR